MNLVNKGIMSRNNNNILISIKVRIDRTKVTMAVEELVLKTKCELRIYKASKDILNMVRDKCK